VAFGIGAETVRHIRIRTISFAMIRPNAIATCAQHAAPTVTKTGANRQEAR
jgi:hypothetical protein